MDIETMVNIDLIDPCVKAKDSTDFFQQISRFLFRKGYVTNDYGQELIKREHNFPTGLATKTVDVAIPHTDAVHVREPFMYLAKMKSRIEFNQMGTLPKNNVIVQPKLIFVLGFTKNEDQLQLLQRLMKLFSNESVMNDLLNEIQREKIIMILKTYLDEIEEENE